MSKKRTSKVKTQNLIKTVDNIKVYVSSSISSNSPTIVRIYPFFRVPRSSDRFIPDMSLDYCDRRESGGREI